ncbi:MAG TPA: hypothetical protein VEA60_01095 [Allosphingosinicella sp.]|nr:hypothetical protein [Allosphingosinicella sp.]
MPGFIRALALGAASLLAAAAAAQEASRPAAEASDIVVTGQDVESQIRDFVGALTVAPPRGQLARFERKVCPAAIGLRPGQKQAVVARLRRVAAAAGLELGGPNCTPNVLLIVTADKRAFLEALARKHDYYFGAMTPTQVRRLVRQPGPATAWQIEGPPLDSDGAETAQGGEAMLPGAEYPVNRTTRMASRITAGGRPQFQAAALVVEAGALDGLTTLQLADYAAMRLFARTDPSRLPDPGPTTILKILDAPMGSEVPLTLTAWDFAFLKGFYASPENLYAASERSEIGRRMAKELQAGGKGEQ